MTLSKEIMGAFMDIVKLIPRFLWLLSQGLFKMVMKIRKVMGDQYFILMLIGLFFAALFLWVLSLG
jgi:hypothetical protein